MTASVIIDGNDLIPVQVLIWSAGEPGDWSWTFSEVPVGTSFTQTGAGTDAVFLDGSEAERGFHLHGSASGAGVAVTNATYERVIENRFRGILGHHEELTDRLDSQQAFRLTEPDGTAYDCPCVSAEDWSPGTYSLAWEGTGAYDPGEQPIVIAGVDLPTWIPG